MGARFVAAVALAMWIGLSLAVAQGTPATLALAALGLALVFVPRVGVVVLALAFLVLGLARGGACAAHHARLASGFADGDGTWRLTAIVAEPPRREADAPVAVVRVIAATPGVMRGARVRVRLPPGSTAEWGDTLHGLARLAAPSPRRVPGGWDAAASAQAAGIVASGRMLTADVRGARGVTTLVPRLAMRVRRAGEAALARGLSPAARELAVPLVFGDRGAMGTDTDATLRASGLVHLLALSGLHVTWLAGAARMLAAVARGGVRARAVTGAVAALLYMLLAGPIPSLARAVAAEAFTALARWRERALDPLQSLGLAAAALLAWQPAWALDLGFQLSCVATFGLVALGSPLAEALAARVGTRPSAIRRAARALAAALALTLGAQLAVLPWLIARFHAVPWGALAGNLLAVPLSEGTLAATVLGAAAEIALPGSGATWFAACETLTFALHRVVEVLGGWPGALPATGDSPWPVAGAVLAALALALGLDPPRTLAARLELRAFRLLACIAGTTCLTLTALILAATPPRLPERGRWWIVALDVGQGDATAIATERGWWLVDAGPRSPRWDAGESAVLPFLRAMGVRRLEGVFVTHDDGDHTGGLAALRRGIAIDRAWGAAGAGEVSGPCPRLGLRPLARGDTIAGLADVRVLWPPRPLASGAAADAGTALARRGDNAASLVLEWGRGEGHALLTADVDSLVEAVLEATPSPALLHAGHHGSGSSSGAVVLARLRPRRVMVSCGLRNPYGHPHAGALARLAAHGAAIDRTDLAGTLWYECSGRGCAPLDWRANAHHRGVMPRVAAAGAARAPRVH
jgi:competence protein ComEC